MNNPVFQTICSISIEVSAFGFLPNDKGSIPLWSTKFRSSIGRVSVFTPKVEGSNPFEITN